MEEALHPLRPQVVKLVVNESEDNMERKTYVRFTRWVDGLYGRLSHMEQFDREVAERGPIADLPEKPISYQFYDRLYTSEVVNGESVLMMSGPINWSVQYYFVHRVVSIKEWTAQNEEHWAIEPTGTRAYPWEWRDLINAGADRVGWGWGGHTFLLPNDVVITDY